MQKKCLVIWVKNSLNYTQKIPHLDDIFSEILELEVSPGEDEQLQPKDKNRRKIKGEKKP